MGIRGVCVSVCARMCCAHVLYAPAMRACCACACACMYTYEMGMTVEKKSWEIWRVSRRKAVASDSRKGHAEHKTFPSLCRTDPPCLTQWFPSLAKVQKEDQHLPCTTQGGFSKPAVGPRLWSWVLTSLFRWDASMWSCSHCPAKVSMIVK